ncbi:MAG: tetratricopeptide repeat protein [Gammaproteobacteria bacterium]|jgi:tetratricopeptide (TPR) repeat protein
MSMLAPLLAGSLLGIWPFSGSDEPAPSGHVGSVGAVSEEQIVDEPIAVSSDRAREHYARYLELETAADPKLRAVALRRLADLTLEAAETRQLDEGMTPLARAELDQAIDLYRRFLAENPDGEEAVRARYQLSRALELGGDTEAGLATLDELVADGGDGPLLAEAQFRRGETLFSRKDWYGAQQAYAEVIALGDGPFTEQAYYKHGWSQFKQGMHEESLNYFFAVLDEHLQDRPTAADMATMERPERELTDDSLRAVSISFTYMEGADSLQSYLAARARPTPYDGLIYESLGALYLEQERYQDAAATFEAFVVTHLDSDAAPGMQARVADAYAAGEFSARVLEAKREYVERFGIGGGYWVDRDPASQPDDWAYLRETLDQLARHYHAMALESSDPADYDEAARWYGEWLMAFPDDETAAEHRFLLAEVLFEAGRYEEAARTYEHAAYGYGPHEHAAESGYAALLAWREQAGVDPAGGWEAMAVESSLQFADAFPEHEQAIPVRTDAARVLFESGDLDRAVGQARIVVESPVAAAPEYQRTAWLVIGHASFDRQDFVSSEGAYVAVLGILEEDDEERPKVRERLAASIYSQAQAAAAAGEVDTAVAHYQRVYAAVPDSETAAVADYDAAVLLMQSGAWQRSVDAMQTFRGRYPGHQFQERVTINLASALMETGDRRQAADELVAIAGLNSQEPEVRRAALWEAAGLMQEAQDLGGAAATWKRYVESYPLPLDQAMQARHTLAEISRQQGDAVKTIFWLEALVAADADSGEARTELSRTLAARATIELVQPQRMAFESISLTAPLDKSLKRKKTAMETALAGYGRAADYGISDVVTESTYRIAEIYHQFGSALMESERPADLDAAALEEYEILLEEQAFPFEEQAIAIHESNAARTRDGVYDTWVIRSFEELAQLVPGRYAREEMGERLVLRID